MTILCDDGNLLECASITLVAALKHFRHPDTTMSGDKPVVHSLRDRDPVPLTFTHHPIFSTYSFLEKGYVLAV
jgi:exosome complex component RRP45